MYDPNIARFLQADPVGYDADVNLYRYCSNNPLNLVDPRGLEGSAWKGKTGHITIHSPIIITGMPTIIVGFHSNKGGASYGTWLWLPSEGEGLRVVWEWKFVGTTPPEAWLQAGYVGPVEVRLINQKHYEQWGHWWGFGESERKWGYTYGNKTETTSGYAYPVGPRHTSEVVYDLPTSSPEP